MFFWERKPMMISEFRLFKILTSFVTSLTPNFTQMAPKKVRVVVVTHFELVSSKNRK